MHPITIHESLSVPPSRLERLRGVTEWFLGFQQTPAIPSLPLCETPVIGHRGTQRDYSYSSDGDSAAVGWLVLFSEEALVQRAGQCRNGVVDSP